MAGRKKARSAMTPLAWLARCARTHLRKTWAATGWPADLMVSNNRSIGIGGKGGAVRKPKCGLGFKPESPSARG